MRRFVFLAISLLLAMAAGACGGDDEPSESAQDAPPATETAAAESPLEGDPCKLLKRERIATLFGERVKGRAEEADDGNICGYRSSREADPDSSPPVPNGIDVFLGVEYFVGLSRELATQRGLEPVRGLPGIGDSAYVSGNEAGAVVGEAGIMVVVLGLDPSQPAVEDLLVDLLEDAVAAY